MPLNILVLVAVGGPALLMLVALADLFCLRTERYTPGQVIEWWARDHPWLTAFFASFVGAFAAHIFWHT
jgi:hypothetical protein